MADKHIKRQHFMLSDYPPWQVYRWTYDTKKQINEIDRFDAEKAEWVRHDNDLIRGAFHDQVDAALSPIPPVTDKEAEEITAEGWTPKLKKKIHEALTS